MSLRHQRISLATLNDHQVSNPSGDSLPKAVEIVQVLPRKIAFLAHACQRFIATSARYCPGHADENVSDVLCQPRKRGSGPPSAKSLPLAMRPSDMSQVSQVSPTSCVSLRNGNSNGHPAREFLCELAQAKPQGQSDNSMTPGFTPTGRTPQFGHAV